MSFKVAYFTNIAPHYRKKLWLEFAKDTEVEFHFFFGKSSSNGIREIDFDETWNPYAARIKRVLNFRFNKILLYQFGVLFQIAFKKWDAIILLGDMNIFSGWLGAWVAKLKGIKVYFWGHGLYGNETPLKHKLRARFLKIADAHFLYGNHAKSIMIKNDFEPNQLHVVYNSLDYEVHKSLRDKVLQSDFYLQRAYFADSNYPVLIFIGRLTPEKKLDLLIHSILLLKSQGLLYNLIIIGEGSQQDLLLSLSESIEGQVFFYGSCYDEVEIGSLIANADLCVSPGNVGLTAIHSLSYGTPVCTHDRFEEQMPEFEAIINMQTGILFNQQKGNLSEAIQKWFNANFDRQTVRNRCYEIIDTTYNPYNQLSIFKEVLLSNKKGSN